VLFSRFCAFVLLVGPHLYLSSAMDLYVSKHGPNGANTPVNATYVTLEAARDAIREMKKSGPLPPGEVTVWVLDGPYEMNASFVLNELDSGTPESPIVYRAKDGVIIGLRGSKYISEDTVMHVTPEGVLQRVDGSAAKPIDESTLKRIDASVRNNVFLFDLFAAGITDLGELPDGFESAPAIPELFVDGHRKMLARWPNEGWAEIAQVVESGPAPWRNHDSTGLGTFEYEGDRPSRWMTAPALWLQGYWCFDWAIETIKVGSIDTAKRQITLAKQHHYGIGSGNPAPRRFMAVNLLEELDEYGEYFIDRKAGLLYYLQGAPITDSTLYISILKEPVFQLLNASYITLREFRIEETIGAGIRIQGGSHNGIVACDVRNTGLEGIVIDGGSNHTIESCDIHDIGTTAISVSGGERKTLASSNHRVLNNHIYNVSQRQRTHAYNILVGGVGVEIAHNRIHDAPHQAIMLSGNNHLIEYNEVYRIGMDSDDCGAFYMGRNPSERGTVIRYNYWHDVGSEMAHGSCAIYFDDGAGGQHVYGNVFYRAAGGRFGAVFSHGGHDNLVENNIFIECNRAMGASPWPDALWQQWLGEPLWQGKLLQEVDITKSPYIDQYPELEGYMESWKRPRLNKSLRNVIVQCDAAIDGNWTLEDSIVLRWEPGFVSAAEKNFALREDSIVFKTLPNFKPIPFNSIGLRVNEFRKELPKKE